MQVYFSNESCDEDQAVVSILLQTSSFSTELKTSINKQYLQICINIYYIHIYTINANCLIIKDPFLLCNKDSQGVIINI